MQLDFAKELYAFEWELRGKLTGWLQIPIATLTVIAALLSYLLQNTPTMSVSLTQLYYLLIVLAAIGWGYGCISICRSFFGYTYEKLPRLSSLNGYYYQLQDLFKDNPSMQGDAKAVFEEYLIRRLAEATDRNGVNNVTKSYWLNQASAATILSLLLTVFVAVLQVYPT